MQLKLTSQCGPQAAPPSAEPTPAEGQAKRDIYNRGTDNYGGRFSAEQVKVEIDGKAGWLIQGLDISVDAKDGVPRASMRFIPQQLEVELQVALANSDLSKLADKLRQLAVMFTYEASLKGSTPRRMVGAAQLALAAQYVVDRVLDQPLDGDWSEIDTCTKLDRGGIFSWRIGALALGEEPVLLWDVVLHTKNRLLSFCASDEVVIPDRPILLTLTNGTWISISGAALKSNVEMGVGNARRYGMTYSSIEYGLSPLGGLEVDVQSGTADDE